MERCLVPAVGRLIVAASADCADLLHLSGFMAGDPFVYAEAEGKAIAVVSALEADRARMERRPDVEIVEWDDALPSESQDKGVAAVVQALSTRLGVGDWQVPEGFPLGLADKLRGRGLGIRAVEGQFDATRIVKTEAEIHEIKSALQATEAAMAASESMLRSATLGTDGILILAGAPLTSERIKIEIDAVLSRFDAAARETIVASGVDASRPHDRGSGVIRAGEPVVVDIFPRLRSTGYWGDMTRTFVKGVAAESVRRAYAAVLEAREAGKRLVRAGVDASVPYEGAKAVLEAHGFQTGRDERGHHGFFHGLGHGLGLEIHEAPRMGKKTGLLLESGNVVTVEPGLYYPEWGGVRLEDVVVVRPDGCETLTRYPDCLELD